MAVDTKSVRYGAFILTFANILSQLMGFVYRMFLSRFIGPEGMGLFQLIFPFYSLSLTIATSGICVAVSRLSAEYLALGNYRALRLLVRRAMTVFLCIFALISLAAFLFADGIALRFLGDERTRLAVFALVPVILFTGIENIHKNFFYGTKTVNPPAISDFFEQLIRMCAVLFLLKLLLPQPDEVMLVIIVAGMLICEIFSSMFLRTIYVKRRKRLPQIGEDDPHMKGRLARIAVPISAANLINNLLSSAIVILIPRLLVASGLTHSQALSEYGILFGMTMPLLNLPSALIVGISLVMIPTLSENVALGNLAELRHKASRAITVTSFAIMPALAVMVPLGPALGKYLFGQNVSSEYLLPLAIGTLLAVFMMMLGSILNGMGKQVIASVNFLVGNAVELVLTIVLTAMPSVRMYGYIIAFVMSTIITFSANLYQVVKASGLQPDWRRWFINPFFASLLAALSARLCFLQLCETLSGGFALLLAIIAAIVIYLLVSAFQGMDPSSFIRKKTRTQ